MIKKGHILYISWGVEPQNINKLLIYFNFHITRDIYLKINKNPYYVVSNWYSFEYDFRNFHRQNYAQILLNPSPNLYNDHDENLIDSTE